MKSQTRGVTFLEIMFAIGILAGVLGPLVYFLGLTHRSTRGSVNEVNATNLATEIMEAVQSLPGDVLSPIDASTPGTFEGDLVQNGVLHTGFFDRVFGEAVKSGFAVNIPPFPKGWNCNLIVTPIVMPSKVADDDSDGKRNTAEHVRQMILITVRVSWKEYGTPRNLLLKTARGRM